MGHDAVSTTAHVRGARLNERNRDCSPATTGTMRTSVDRAQRGGGEQDESPEREPTKTWQDATRENILISVHDFSETPETQPFNPVSCHIHPQQADTHSYVKRGAEETH
jgi:hypothetical protein